MPRNPEQVVAEIKGFLDRVGNVLGARKELGPDATPHRRAAGAFVTGGSLSSTGTLVLGVECLKSC